MPTAKIPNAHKEKAAFVKKLAKAAFGARAWMTEQITPRAKNTKPESTTYATLESPEAAAVMYRQTVPKEDRS
jgi:streptogramin lyase